MPLEAAGRGGLSEKSKGQIWLFSAVGVQACVLEQPMGPLSGCHWTVMTSALAEDREASLNTG